MVTVDVDHPDIEAYVDWKVVEEQGGGPCCWLKTGPNAYGRGDGRLPDHRWSWMMSNGLTRKLTKP